MLTSAPNQLWLSDLISPKEELYKALAVDCAGRRPDETE